MIKAKLFESIGFVILMVAFILFLCNSQGYFTTLSEHNEIFGLLGIIIWSIAYAQRQYTPQVD